MSFDPSRGACSMSVRWRSFLRPRGRGVSIPPFNFSRFWGWRELKSTEPVSGVGV